MQTYIKFRFLVSFDLNKYSIFAFILNVPDIVFQKKCSDGMTKDDFVNRCS